MIIGMFLGMVMVLGILGVIVMVRMYSDIKKLKGLGKSQEEIIREVDQMINRRIDGEIGRTVQDMLEHHMADSQNQEQDAGDAHEQEGTPFKVALYFHFAAGNAGNVG